MERSDFPEVGTRLTYGEAIPAYNRFERSMLERVYGDRLPVRQPGANFGKIAAFHMVSYHLNRALILWRASPALHPTTAVIVFAWVYRLVRRAQV